MKDRDSGESRGFGFVTFETESSMNDAIDAMDGQDLGGRTIRVNPAGELSGSAPRAGGGGGVTNWTADPAIFPSGMAAIDEALGGMPMIMHNRQWSPISDYVHNLSFTWQSGGSSELCHGKCPLKSGIRVQ